jgi:hypothetical protein
MTRRKITDVTVSTIATGPLRGLIEIHSGDLTFKFELNEDSAHAVCAELEHFLTQRPCKVQGHTSSGDIRTARRVT